MGHRQRQIDRGRWARQRIARQLRDASRQTFAGCTGGVVCYGVPLERDPTEMTQEELARYRRLLADFIR